MMRAARKELGFDARQTIMIGDTMETDILGGLQMEYKTILVLSGNTQKSDLAYYAYQPGLMLDSVADIMDRIKTAFNLPVEQAILNQV